MKKFLATRTMFISAVITLWLLAVSFLTDLTEGVLNSEAIINFDKHYAALFLSWRTIFGVKLFSVITFFANLEFALPLVLTISLFLLYKKYYTSFWPFIWTIISAESVTLIGKLLVQRVRPEDGAVVMLDFSFPSGHATIAVALYGFLAYLIYKKTASKLAVLASTILIILIGWSRLYLGVHYVSDIIAGYLVGLLALLIGISLGEWLKFKANQKLKPRQKLSLKSKG